MEKFFKNFDKAKFLKNTVREHSKYPVISACPVCHGDLHVVKLECDQCGSKIEGQFTLSKFNYLDSDKLFFIEVFVKNRGNIKAIEKEMDISYPTVKKLLDDVIVGLGYQPESGEVAEEPTPEPLNQVPKKTKMEIIEKLQKGEISVAEATELLKKIR
ncbi:MAG: DUF2089 domain-containing protein [Bacteroidales bacterium]|jgi:hypothetical protein